MSIYSIVRENVPIREVAERCGLAVRGKSCLCPFHDDHHPSLVLYDDHYHCFACGAHGDVTDLAARLLGVTNLSAARFLAADYGLEPQLRREAGR